MTIRGNSRGGAATLMLLLFLAGRARAQEGKAGFSDPNLPSLMGDIALAPNDFNANRMVYMRRSGTMDSEPEIDIQFGTSLQAMGYIGYNDEGVWLSGQDGFYTVKGNVITRYPKTTPLPRNLRNGSEAYHLAMSARSKGGDKAPAAAATPPGNSAQAGSEAFRDPNLPNASGDVTLAPNNAGATRMVYTFRNGPNGEPDIRIAFGTSTAFRGMMYYGYGDEGSWLGDRQGVPYTLRGNVLTRQPANTQIPKDLRNGSGFYRTHVLGKAEADTAPAAAAPPAASLPDGRVHVLATPPGSTSGTDARIERAAAGITLSYRDAGGEHRYTVRRPVTATAGTDAVDTGGWIYVAADGKSGMLFNVSANHSVSVMPLAQPMLGMLAGRGGN
ncbi:MAG TPA: hypothetical protein VMH80_03820 [Bryobacteraceae bacterium]|nr:hypothetical protein [Bryobacteraceae bacterium]